MALTKGVAGKLNTTSAFGATQDTEYDRPMVISNSAKAIAAAANRLIDLYTDPIGASVRETVSNAIDATLNVFGGRANARQNGAKIEISTPTSADPNLRVRDYGQGMTADEFMSNFSDFFASGKSDDLEAIGAYGLGAKSPLSYTGSFHVYTVCNGVKSHGVLRRLASGPRAMVISQESTNEPSGTEVVIPVAVDDFYKFEQVAGNYTYAPSDVEIVFNGEKSDPVYTEIGSILLDADDQVYGRVWGSTDKSFLTNTASGSDVRRISEDAHNIAYALHGYVYSRPGRQYGSHNPRILVEIVPGLVNFSTPRDAITVDSRSNALELKVLRYLSDETVSIRETMRLMELLDDSVALSTLASAYKIKFNMEDGTVSMLAEFGDIDSMTDANSRRVSMKIEDFVKLNGLSKRIVDIFRPLSVKASGLIRGFDSMGGNFGVIEAVEKEVDEKTIVGFYNRNSIKRVTDAVKIASSNIAGGHISLMDSIVSAFDLYQKCEIVVVFDSKVSNVSGIMRHRKAFSAGTRVIITSAKLTDVIKDAMKQVAEMMDNCEFTIFENVAALATHARKARLSVASSASNGEKRIPVLPLKIESRKHMLSLTSLGYQYSNSFEFHSIEDLVESNAVILVTEFSSYSQKLGEFLDGVDQAIGGGLVGSSVFLFCSDMNKAEFEPLMSEGIRDRVFFRKDFHHRAASVKEFARERAVAPITGGISDYILDFMTVEQVNSLVAGSRLVGVSAWTQRLETQELSQHLDKVVSKMTAVKKIADSLVADASDAGVVVAHVVDRVIGFIGAIKSNIESISEDDMKTLRELVTNVSIVSKNSDEILSMCRNIVGLAQPSFGDNSVVGNRVSSSVTAITSNVVDAVMSGLPTESINPSLVRLTADAISDHARSIDVDGAYAILSGKSLKAEATEIASL